MTDKSTLLSAVCDLFMLCVLQELGLQAEDSFVLKVVQLEELRHVRHSIMVIGNAGTGKSMVRYWL